MSCDLLSYIRYVEKPDLNKQIVASFATYEFDIKLHPEFDLLSSSFFQPFTFLKSSKFFDGQVDFNILSGCDLDVYPMDNPEADEMLEEDEVLKNYNPTHWISSSARHSEFELITSSILMYSISRIYNGIFRDPQFKHVFIEEKLYYETASGDKEKELIKYLESVKQDLKAVIEEEKELIKQRDMNAD